MTYLLIGAIVVPLVGAAVAYLSAPLLKAKTGYAAALLSLVPLAAILVAGNDARSTLSRVYSESYSWAPIGTFGLRVDNLSLPILLTISLLSALIAVFSVPYMKERIGDNPGRYGLYYSLYMLYSLGMLGTVFASNLIEFYLFFEIMLVPSFFLIAEWGYGDRAKISISYFIWTHVGALILLVGILVTGFLAGSTDMDSVVNNLATNPNLISTTVRLAVVGAMCIGLFVKIAQFGLHTWLPSAYAEAPTPISALLASAMTGIGGYAIVRLVITIYPSAFSTLSPIFTGWALITMFYGAGMALVQDDIKRLLAYSSMSQMGYILFGLATFTSFGISGSMFQYISNATAKGILFIVVGAVMLQFRGERSMSKMGGLAGKMPITASAAFIGSLALMGFPTTNGFFSEFLLFQGAFIRATGSFSDYEIIVAVLGVVATAFTAGYSLMALRKIFFGPAKAESADVKEAPWSITIPLIVLSIVTIGLGLYPTPVISRLVAYGQSIAGILN